VSKRSCIQQDREGEQITQKVSDTFYKNFKGCPFKGKVFEVKAWKFGIKYIDCQRDKKDAQEHFIITNKDESLLLWIHQTEFLHCLYSNESICKGGTW